MDDTEPFTPEQQQQRAEVEAAFRKRWTSETFNPLPKTIQKAVWLGFCQGWLEARTAASSST